MSIGWRERIGEYQSQAISAGVDIVDINDAKRQQYLGLQLFLENKIATGLLTKTKQILPTTITDKLYWQDPSSIHLSLQSTLLGDRVIDDAKILSLSDNLESFFKSSKAMDGHLMFPIFAKSGIIGICDQIDTIYGLRKNMTDIWNKNKLQPGLSEEYWNFPHIFLGRFIAGLTPAESKILVDLPIQSVETKLVKVKLCLSDKFISPETVKVIREFKLN